MKRVLMAVVLILALLVAGCQQGENGAPAEGESLILATTTSTYDSGLLDYLLPEFEEANNIEVDVIAVGTGQAIEIGKSGDCDIILVHARELEDQFVAEGYGTQRWDVMYNDYVYLGPKGTAEIVAASGSLKEALEAMVEYMEAEGINFVSRGDNSGTHTKEKNLWALLEGRDVESEDWYLSIGQGMGDTLVAANEMQAFTLTDRGTYLAMQDNLPNLEIVFEGDENLFNPYGIIPVNPEKHPHVKHEAAMKLVEFFISDEIQAKIGQFGTEDFGQPLFFPNAR